MEFGRTGTIKINHFILNKFAFFLIIGLTLAVTAILPVPVIAKDKDRIMPPSEWAGMPEWSPNGKYILVDWPCPPILQPDGKVTRIIDKSKPIKNQSLSQMLPSTLDSKRAPVILSNLLDRKTVLLDAKSYRFLGTIPKTLNSVWSPDSNLLALMDSEVEIFDLSKGEVALKIDGKCNAFLGGCIWIPSTKKRIAAVMKNGIHVYELPSGVKIYSLPDLVGRCGSLACSPDGKELAACGSLSDYDYKSCSLRLAEIDSGKTILSIDKEDPIVQAAWSPNGKYLAYSDKTIHVLDAETKKQIIKFVPEDSSGSASFSWSPNGRLLAYKGNSEYLHVCNTNSWTEQTKFSAEKTGRFSYSWSPNSKYLLVSAVDKKIAICDAITGEYLGAKRLNDLTRTKWTPNGNSLVVSDFSKSSVFFLSLRFQDGQLAFNNGIKGNPWQNQRVPRNIEDCFEELRRFFGKKGLEQFKSTKEKELFKYTSSMGIGMAVRNTWGLNGNTPIAQYFQNMGVKRGSSMSTIIIEAFWRHLNGKPIDFDEHIEKYKLYEERNEVLLHENKKLSNDFLKYRAIALDGKTFSIETLPGKVKVVCFIQDIAVPSRAMLSSLEGLRKIYSEEDVSIAVFKFTSEDLGYKQKKIEGDLSSEIECIISRCKKTIPVSCGSKEVLEYFFEFANGRVKPMSGGLPQALIMDSSGKVITRFNGWYPGKNNPEAFKYEIDKIFKKSKEQLN